MPYKDMPDCRTYWLHALTPVHAGVGIGQSFIDQPIMREKITNWPIIPGSSVKGVQRDAFDGLEEVRDLAFGKGDDDAALENANAGAVVFTDARIVCLAAQSYYGTFAYVTSPLVLSRLKRDAEAAGTGWSDLPEIELVSTAALPGDSLLKRDKRPPTEICLGELNLPCADSSEAVLWGGKLAKLVFPEAWHATFLQRFVIVPDETFNFLCETGCEVNARIKIERSRKIVEKGHFWYEESLPAESILSGLVWCDRIYRNGANWDSTSVLDKICTERILQIGGKASVGKGRMRCCYEATNA